MNVMVLGATGVLGRNVIPRLLEQGHRVRAVVRRIEQVHFLQQAGVEARLGDILDPESLARAARGAQAALHLATAIPRNGQADWSLNDRIRREGTRNLLEAAAANGVRRYIQQSITLLYGEKGQEIVDEAAALQVTPLTASAADMEEMVRASPLEWSILRGGIFYGPGTGREDEWRQAARKGRLQIPGDGKGLISLVHVVDMARAVVAALERAPSHSLYNIVDDEPARIRDVFHYVATQIDAKVPAMGAPVFLPSLGARNVKAQIELGWRPVFPNYTIGLAYDGSGELDPPVELAGAPSAAVGFLQRETIP